MYILFLSLTVCLAINSLIHETIRIIAFHPSQPLLVAALHNGSVQLWNYRMGVLVDRFEEHEGERDSEIS
jgi:hypothetical protein